MSESGKKKHAHRLTVRLVKFLDLVGMVALFAWIWLGYYQPHLLHPFYNQLAGNTAVIFVYTLIYYQLSHVYGSYLLHTSRISDLVYSQILSSFITNFLMFLIILLMNRHWLSLWAMLGLQALQSGLAIGWCLWAHNWYFRNNAPLSTVVIWDERPNIDKLINEYVEN